MKINIRRCAANITVILVCSIIVNILIFSLKGTYSWFNAVKKVSVKADVSKENQMFNVDITYATYINNSYKIDKVRVIGEDIDYNPESPILNPVSIIVTPMSNNNIYQNSDIRPIIYFAVDGELKNFMLHISPIKFNGNKSVSYVNINTRAYQVSNINSEDKTNGVLTIGYLNNYIEKQINIQFDNKELKGRFSDPVNKQWYDNKII